jgi:hypothetical protein
MHTTAARLGGTMTRPEPTGPGALSMFGTLSGMSVLIAVLVAGGTGLGHLADRALGTSPLFVFVGLVLGVVAAVLATRSIITRYFRS